jgi:hypothetical protein
MSPFLKCRNAVAKAGLFSLRVLGWPEPSRIPAERIELATRIKGIRPQPSPFLEAISSQRLEDSSSELSPGALPPFTEPQSSVPRLEPAPGKIDPTALQNLHMTLVEREKRRDHAEIVLDELGYYWNRQEWRPNPDTEKGAAILAEADPLLELETGKRRDRLTKHDLDRAEAACATLARQGYTWNGGAYWKPPLGKPPAYVRTPGEQLDRIADRLGVPVSTFQETPAKPPAERAEDVRVFPRAGGAARVLEGMGWRWIAGRWIAPPPVETAPAGVADKMRDAIAFALSDHNPDGLEWLRAWEEGDPTAERELEEWATREREAAQQRRRNMPCPSCGAREGLPHFVWCKSAGSA